MATIKCLPWYIGVNVSVNNYSNRLHYEWSNCLQQYSRYPVIVQPGQSSPDTLGQYSIGCSLQGINALYLMDIKFCVSFTELGTVVLFLGDFVMGKNTPQLKISRVKWQNNITFFDFSIFFSFFLHPSSLFTELYNIFISSFKISI